MDLWEDAVEEPIEPVEKNPFNDLPIAVQNRIFSFVSQQSRQTIRAVCLKWKQVLAEFPVPEFNNEDYERTAKLRDLIFVKVSNFTIEFKASTIIAFKETLRRLQFSGLIDSSNLVHLLRECNLVKELNFKGVSLDTTKTMQWPEELTLPEVKVIALDTKSHVELTLHEMSLLDFVQQIKFVKLQEVSIRSPQQRSLHLHYTPYDYDEFVLEMKNPCVEIEPSSAVQPTGLVGLLVENRQTLRKFIVDGLQSRPFGCPAKELAKKIDQLQFEQMKCRLGKTSEVFPDNESLLVVGQLKLKELEIDSKYDCWPELTRVVEANAASLIRVSISITIREFDPLDNLDWENIDELDINIDEVERLLNGGLGVGVDVNNQPLYDAAIFKDCTKLEYLLCYTRTQISNLTSLPVSIQRLSLSGTWTRENLLAIASKLRNLKEFVSIASFGDDPVPTLTVDIIQAFTGIETLENMFISGYEANEEDISNYANSQHAFEITFTHFIAVPDADDVIDDVVRGSLLIKKMLTEPELPTQ